MTTQTKAQRWTPGAMRAAYWLKMFPNKPSTELARIISNETHDAEMAELLRQVLEDRTEACWSMGSGWVERTELLLCQIEGAK